MISEAVNWVCIRPMTHEDIKAVLKIDSAYLKSPASQYWLKEMRKTFPDLAYVAIDGRGSDKMVGYILGNERSRVGYEEGEGERVGFVSRMAVLHEFRRHGVGTMLMEALEYAFVTYHRYPMSMLAVRKTNENAIKFYKSLGYRHIEAFDDPKAYEYGDSEEEKYRMFMMKNIQPDRAFDFNTCSFIEKELGITPGVKTVRKAKKYYQRLRNLL